MRKIMEIADTIKTMDRGEGPIIRPLTPLDSGVFRTHYRQIGETLLICEAASYRVGVAWLPPTKRVRILRNKFEKPLDEFVRYNLVTVNTKTLDAYCDDLENCPEDASTDSKLYIELRAPIERYALPAVLAVVAFLGTLSSLLVIHGSAISALLVAMIVSGLATITGVALSCDAHRWATFHWLLYRELQRRRGTDDSDTTKVKIFTPRPNWS